MHVCECVCVLIWASLPYACHSRCLCFIACLVHFIVYAGNQGPTAGYQHHVEIHWSRSWSALIPNPGSSTVESHETKLHPGLASHPASPSPPRSQSLTVSVCISAQQILTKEVTDLPHSLILYHIHVWPNMAQEWAIHIHVRVWKDAVCIWRNEASVDARLHALIVSQQ